MEFIFVMFVSFSLLLFIISFFIKDPYKDIKSELDQLSLQHIQDIYQINRKLKVLEEELLINDFETEPAPMVLQPNKKEIHAIIKNQVKSLYQQGLTMEQISKQSSLHLEDVQDILKELTTRGYHNE